MGARVGLGLGSAVAHGSGLPILGSVMDLVEIGAGGGSIAWIDAGGLLRVGPRSAGADPGPACYGRGGTEPTVTDANVFLGRIGASSIAGGRLRLDAAAARDGDRPARRSAWRRTRTTPRSRSSTSPIRR